MMHFLRKLRSNTLPGIAAVIILLSFFMSWVAIGCCSNGFLIAVESQYSGRDLAHNVSKPNLDLAQLDADPIYFTIPLIALSTLLIIIASHIGLLNPRQTAILFVISGTIGLVIQLYLFVDLQSTYGNDSYSIRYQTGWWLTALAFFVTVAGGCSAYRNSKITSNA